MTPKQVLFITGRKDTQLIDYIYLTFSIIIVKGN